MSDSEETGVSHAIDETSPVVSEYDLRASHLVDTFDAAPQTRAQKKKSAAKYISTSRAQPETAAKCFS